METVGDLRGRRGSTAGALGVATGPVAADRFNTRVTAKPVGQCLGLSICQQRDDPSGFHVDEDGAVVLSFGLGPIVDTENAWRRLGGDGRGSDVAQQRIAAGGGAEMLTQPSASLATERHADVPLPLAQAVGLPAPWANDGRQPLTEDL